MTLSSQSVRRLSRVAASTVMVAVVTWIAYAFHAKAFIAGFLYLLLILPIAIEWGFIEATVASVMAIAFLDYLFTEPLFAFSMSDPQDWVALGAFEAVVLTVSHLAGKLRHHAIVTAIQQANVDRLYTMSKELLLVDRGNPAGEHVTRIIVEVFGASGAALWDSLESRTYAAGEQRIPDQEVRYVGLNNSCEDDAYLGKYTRALSQQSRMLGALCIVTGPGKARINGRIVDAIASLAAIALERERAFLAESRAEASRQGERLRSAVLDGLAHAYKTPLATIQAASSGMLEINRLNEVEKELTITIQSQVQLLADLTSQALQTARLETEHLKLQPERIALKPFLRSDWSPYVQGLEGRALEIDVGEADRTLWADPKLLRMVMAQLLDNASKYSKPATPIRLRVSSIGSQTVISVHNCGSFISPLEREKIFERFYRSAESPNHAPGTGIGLTVSRQIAEAHRGHIWVESDPSTGTTFYLGLPNIVQEVR